MRGESASSLSERLRFLGVEGPSEVGLLALAALNTTGDSVSCPEGGGGGAEVSTAKLVVH